MTRTSPYAILGVVICTFFTAAGQVFWKLGSEHLVYSWQIIFNWQLLLGFVLYGLSLLLLTASFRHGELSVLFPFISLSFIWVSVLAVLFLGESMSFVNWLGVACIVSGVSCIGVGKDA